MEEKEYLPSPSPQRSNSQWATGHSVNSKSIKLQEKCTGEKSLQSWATQRILIWSRRKMWQNAIYQNLNLSLKRYHWENKKAVHEKEQKPPMWTEWVHFLILGKRSTPEKGGCKNSSQAYRGAPSIKVTAEGKLNHDDTSAQALSLEPTGWLCQEPGREEWCDHGWHATQHGHFWKHRLLGFHPFGSIYHQRQDSRACRASRLLFQLIENWDCLPTLGLQCPRVHPYSSGFAKMGKMLVSQMHRAFQAENWVSNL